MSSIPVVCPNCYRTQRSALAGPDGLIRCDGCGHAFPLGGLRPAPISPSAYGQPSPFSAPIRVGPPVGASVPGPGGDFANFQPPAANPPSGPGLITCLGIIVLVFGSFACCGGGSLYYLMTHSSPLAHNDTPQPVMPAVNPPAIQPAPPNVFPGPGVEAPGFMPPEFRPPPITPPGFAPPVNPADNASAGPQRSRPERSNDPATSGTPRSGSLDDLIARLENAERHDPAMFQVMQQLQSMPVEESRRSDVVAGVLHCLANDHAIGAAFAQPVLERWASKAEADQLAEFAASDAPFFVRRPVVNVIATTGGTADTAETIAPLLKDLSLRVSVRDALIAIGSEAEEPVLALLEESDISLAREIFRVLGTIGGEKSKKRLTQIADSSDFLKSRFAREALAEIERRGE
jgi:hypothetical protein